VSPTSAPVQSEKREDPLYPMLVRVPRELHDLAKRRAREEDRTLAMIVRRALREYLAQPVV
jgi:predicted HicB family RNase H-like nuclease